MEKIKIALNKFRVRLSAAYRILFRPSERFLIIRIDEANLTRMLKADMNSDVEDYTNVEIDYTWHGLQKYNVYKLVQIMNDNIDPDEMILRKADYQVSADEWAKKNLHS